TRSTRDWSSDVCSSDLMVPARNPTRSFVQHAAAGSAPPRATAPGAARHSKSKRSTVTPVGRGSPRNGASRLGAGERAGGKPAQQDQAGVRIGQPVGGGARAARRWPDANRAPDPLERAERVLVGAVVADVQRAHA